MGKLQINFQIDETQKDDWEEYIEESGYYNTISDLIRTAVEKEINETDESQASMSPALDNDLNSLKQDIDRIRKDVSWLKNQHQDTVNISDLAQDIFNDLEKLPEPASVTVPDDIDDEESYLHKQAAIQLLTPDDESEADEVPSYTINSLADRFGVTEDRVKDAIEHLKDQFLPIVEVEIKGQTQYFKEA